MQRFTEGLIIALAIPALTVLAITSVTDESASDFIQQADKNHDGYITPDELKAAMASWLGGREGATQEQLSSALETAFPEPIFMAMISPPQSRTPNSDDVQKMEAALPSTAPAKAAKPRKVLVVCKCAGYVHSCIPLAAKTIEQL